MSSLPLLLLNTLTLVRSEEPEAPVPSKNQPLFRPSSPESEADEDELAAGLANLSVERAPPTPASKGKSRAIAPPSSPPQQGEEEDEGPSSQESLNMPPDNRTLLMSEQVDLCLFDGATEMFMEQEKATQANLWVVKGLAFPCMSSRLHFGFKLMSGITRYRLVDGCGRWWTFVDLYFDR